MGVKETLTNGVSREIIIVIILLAMVGMWAWALGKVPIPGEHGFVLRSTLAGEVQTIVGEDINDLKSQSANTEQKVDEIRIALNEILADYYSKRIKAAVRQRCKEEIPSERDRLWDQIGEDLNRYRRYSGDATARRPTCDEV